MNAPHRLQGVPEINLAHIGKAFADGRAYRQLERICAEKPFRPAAVHKRIPERRFGFSPPINWREIVVLYLSAAVIGAMVVSL